MDMSSARVTKSIVTKVVMSAAEKLSRATAIAAQPFREVRIGGKIPTTFYWNLCQSRGGAAGLVCRSSAAVSHRPTPGERDRLAVEEIALWTG
jgi:hypothetical protein